MRLATALLCSVLMTSGCGDVKGAQGDLSRLLSAKDTPAATLPPRKASLTSLQKAPAKPSSGPGAASKEAPAAKCLDVNPAAYRALEEPTALPPAKPLLAPGDVKKWIEGAEGQIDKLKGHLRESTTSLSACHAKS